MRIDKDEWVGFKEEWINRRSLQDVKAFWVFSHLLMQTVSEVTTLPNGVTLLRGECFIPVSRLAKKTGINAQVIERMIADWCAEELIEVVEQRKHGKHIRFCDWRGGEE